MPNAKPSAAPRPQLFRSVAMRAAPQATYRTAGRFQAGLVKGISLITRGESLGHGMWCDSEFVRQVGVALADEGSGIKSRFTHPDMCSDGLGKFLGRITHSAHSADRVHGDLHIAKSAHRSPEGNLAEYVMDRADEDPASCGLSIVFYHDRAAEVEFHLEHGAEEFTDEDGYKYLDLSNFESPDPDNVNGLYHCRLESLEACDLVDEPAANPGGLFRRDSELLADAESLLDYVLGLSADVPQLANFDVHPERAKQFLTRYLSRRKISLGGIQMPKKTRPAKPTAQDATPDPAPQDPETTPAAPQEPPAPAAEPTPAPADATDPEAGADPDSEPQPDQGDQAPPAETPADSSGGATAAGADRPLAEYCAAFGDGPGARAFLNGVPFAEASAQQLAALRDENARLKAKIDLAAKEHPDPLNVGKQGKTLRELTRIRGKAS